MQNVSSLHIIKTLSAVEQNAILMQNKNEFGIEKSKGFKSEKTLIYIRKNIYELKSWIYTCKNAFFLKGFQKNFIKVHWVNQFLNLKKHQIMKRTQIQCWNNDKKLFWLWFCFILQNDIDYSENRIINIIIKYKRACQQKKQKIISFIVYLDSMNNEFEYNNEQQQRYFLMKMHSVLQRKI